MSDLSKKIVETLSNESLREAFTACPTVADAVKLLAENGVETTESELKEALMQVMKRAKLPEGELSEEQLEQIAGGYSWSEFFSDLWRAIGSMGMGTGSNY